MAGARRLLRPVSQELTKFHPDFADIFGYDSEVDALPREGEGGEGDNPSSLNGEKPLSESAGGPHLPASTHFTDVTPAKYQNGLKVHDVKENGTASFGSGNSQTTPASGQSNNEDRVFHGSRDTSTIPNQPKTPGVNLRRTQSMESRPRLQAGRNNQGKFHKRQLSVTPVIPEDPREHLYNVARTEPFSNAQPSTASLPLASSFGLDYSFNVTYAQLADFRRKQREGEMGGKMDELSAEIQASSTVPKSPFDRANIGEKSATRSVSTGSSETGVSKSKKKKAPAPPPPANVPPLTRQSQRDQSPSRLSMTTEPPADYDMGSDTPPASSPTTSGRALHRSYSSAGEYETSGSPARLTERNSGHEPSNNDVALSPPPPPPPPAPPLPGTPGAAMFSSAKSAAAKPAKAEVKTNSSLATPVQSGVQKSIAEAKAQIEELKRLQDILRNGENAKPEEIPSPSDNTTEEKAIETLEKACEEEGQSESVDSPSLPKASSLAATEVAENKSVDSGVKVSTPRLSSLLQHDIVIAAQARGAKIMKSKPPPALEKPKDMAELFREQLAKAAQAREERMSREAASDDVKNNNKYEHGESKPKDGDPSFVFPSSFLKSSKIPPPTAVKPSLKAFTNVTGSSANDNAKIKIGNDTQETDGKMKEIWIPEIEDRDERDSSLVSKRSSIQSEDMSISSSNASQRVFPPSWTPEDDLDSDDDMNESAPPFTQIFGAPRNLPNAGFKSSVLPTKIDSLKKDEKKKKEKKEKEKMNKEEQLLSSPRQRVPEEAKKSQVVKPEDADEKKIGNLRKLQKGVKNAFGSISKASGKLLKRRKSQEILDIPGDTIAQQHTEVSMNPNWTLGDTTGGSLRRVASEGHMPVQDIYQNGVTNGHKSGDDSSSSSSSESDDSDNDIGDVDFAEGINDIPSSKKRESRKSKADKVKAMTRAGVAYVSPDGQIFVLPEESTDKRNSKKGSGINNFEKKQKKSSGAGILPTSKLFEKASKKLPFASSLERRGKDKVVETTGQSGQGADLRRIQELEAQERLHRLETAKMQEQITRLQRQQLERSHADLSSNSVDEREQAGGNTSARSVTNNHTEFYNDGNTQHYNGSGFISRQPHQADTSAGFGFDPAFNRYSAPSLPSNPTSYIARPTEPRLATTSDPANFTAHSAPLVGGHSNLGSAPRYSSYSLPNFTPQELAYLSEYMRVMGVTPPSTQQQWAVLLNSFNTTNNNNINALGNKNMSNFNHHILQGNHTAPGLSETILYREPSQGNHTNHSILGSSVLGAGPNLSQVMGEAKTIPMTSENQLLSLRPASSVAATSAHYPAPFGGHMTSLDSARNSDVATPYSSLISDNSNRTSLTNTTDMMNFISPQTNTTMNTHFSPGEIGPGDSNMSASTGLQSGGPHVLNSPSDTAGRGPVRAVTISGSVTANGIYGPMGFRQVST